MKYYYAIKDIHGCWYNSINKSFWLSKSDHYCQNVHGFRKYDDREVAVEALSDIPEDEIDGCFPYIAKIRCK